MKGLYYFSNLDNQVHNLNDTNYLINADQKSAEIINEDLEVIDEVILYSFQGIMNIINI